MAALPYYWFWPSAWLKLLKLVSADVFSGWCGRLKWQYLALWRTWLLEDQVDAPCNWPNVYWVVFAAYQPQISPYRLIILQLPFWSINPCPPSSHSLWALVILVLLVQQVRLSILFDRKLYKQPKLMHNLCELHTCAYFHWQVIYNDLKSFSSKFLMCDLEYFFLKLRDISMFFLKFIYCFTAQVLKVRRTPHPTAYPKTKMLQLDKVCLKS